MCVSWGEKCSFFGKFDVLCFLEAPVLRFALLPYYRRSINQRNQICNFSYMKDSYSISTNVRNLWIKNKYMLRVNIKNTGAIKNGCNMFRVSMASFCFLHYKLETYLTHFSCFHCWHWTIKCLLGIPLIID